MSSTAALPGCAPSEQTLESLSTVSHLVKDRLFEISNHEYKWVLGHTFFQTVIHDVKSVHENGYEHVGHHEVPEDAEAVEEEHCHVWVTFVQPVKYVISRKHFEARHEGIRPARKLLSICELFVT